MNTHEIPDVPNEYPEPSSPEETPALPDFYEPDSPNSPEPEPFDEPEPNGK